MLFETDTIVFFKDDTSRDEDGLCIVVSSKQCKDSCGESGKYQCNNHMYYLARIPSGDSLSACEDQLSKPSANDFAAYGLAPSKLWIGGDE